MDFSWTEDQIARRNAARAFAAEHLSKDLLRRDAEGSVDAGDLRALWDLVADEGILGLCVPADYGGQALDIPTTILVLEAIGYGCRDNGLTLALNGQIWAVQEPILSFGSAEQKQHYLPAMVRGDIIGAHGMTEAVSGSDATSMASTAIRDGDSYVLNGEKTMVGMAPACDMAIVFASTNPDRGAWGISAFLVDAATPGFDQSGQQAKMGLRTSPMGLLRFNDCRIPASARLGPEGAGSAIFQSTMEWERRFIFCSHIGAMERQLEICLDHARTRETFGKKIIEHQSVSNRIADMALRLETSKLLLYKAAWAMETGQKGMIDAAMVKLHLSESFLASSLDALRIHGGLGYMSDAGIERDLRDAAGGVIYSGTSDIQRQLIAQLLETQG